MNSRDDHALPVASGSPPDVFDLARRIADYDADEIYGGVGLGPNTRSDPGWESLPVDELPWNDPSEADATSLDLLPTDRPRMRPIRPSGVDNVEVHRPGRARLLTGVAAVVALIVLVAGLAFANVINRRQEAPTGPAQPLPSPTPSTTTSTKTPPPLADPFGGLDTAGRTAAVTACTKAFATWNKDAQEFPSTTSGYTLKAAATGVDSKGTKVTTVVLTNQTTRLVCNTKPSGGLREPIKDATTSATSAKTFAFSDSDTENYGLGAQDLVWAGGRLPASVTGLSYTWPDKHVAAASISADGYWVVQYLAPKVFTTGSYNDLPPIVVRLRLADGRTKVLKLGFDSNTSCAAVNLGGC